MKNKPLIIGISGPAKSGKDTAARGLRAAVETFDIPVAIAHLADPIREIGEVFGFTQEQMTVQSLKETYKHPTLGVTPRKFMQLVGSEMFRNNLDKDVWCKLLEKKIKDFVGTGDLGSDEQREFDFGDRVWVPRCVVIVPDVRFPNEAETIKRLGGFIFKIERPFLNGGDDWRKHESEEHLNEIEGAVITNKCPSAFEWSVCAPKNICSYLREKYGMHLSYESDS